MTAPVSNDRVAGGLRDSAAGDYRRQHDCRIQTPMLLARPGVCATVSELFLRMVLIRLSLPRPSLAC